MEEKEFINEADLEDLEFEPIDEGAEENGVINTAGEAEPYDEDTSYGENAVQEGEPLAAGEADHTDSAEEITDYTEDLSVLANEFPAMRGASDLSALKNPTRYTELRDLGLSPKEAYLATSEARVQMRDNRDHLGGSVPKAASVRPGAMSSREFRRAREMFGNISDSEIIKLYKRVTQNQ